ncbi:MAG: hypothetical protein RL077_6360 [Verrucomicrobiota bacterium]|jgi:ribosomal protein L36
MDVKNGAVAPATIPKAKVERRDAGVGRICASEINAKHKARQPR